MTDEDNKLVNGLMRDGLFHMNIPDSYARTLKRDEYYKMKSWLRNARRVMIQEAQAHG